jgi:tetratricopeptide (TPR) repeat protein
MQGVRAVETGNVDDYTQILSVFPDSKEESVSAATGNMDRAIEKGTKLIKEHSIRVKPRKKEGKQSALYLKWLSQNEFNKWVDNAYLMIGKSHFYKHEFFMAQETFNFIFREFQTGPEWYEAEIWNARAAIEQGDYSQAQILLDNHNIEGKAPEKLYPFFTATYADLKIRQGKYKEAIPLLEEAVAGVLSKYYHRRFNFILAQLHYRLRNYEQAREAYGRVIKSNPPYEMAFNAKVNRASVMFGEGGLSAVQKEIKKLLRDKRNIEFEDQIYYAMGTAYKLEQQEQNAYDNFLLSVAKSTINAHQKGLSFYELAQIHYKKSEYKPSYYYLDSAQVNLNENFTAIEEIRELHKSLEILVENINAVEREDSLQRIASLPKAERNALVSQWIKAEKDRQKALKEQQRAQEEGGFMSTPYGSSSPLSQGGNWYFYNPNSVSMGKMEFEKRWGRRKLEDNWRRSNKEVVIEQPQLDDPEAEFGDMDYPVDSLPASEAEVVQKLKPNTREAYLDALPLTDEKLAKSHKTIQESLISMGLIYKDELINIPLAIEAFSELVRRYPNSTLKEDALMNLYLCYQEMGDEQSMTRIKKQLETEFPDGEFTAYLADPDFFKKRAEKQQKIEQLYEQTYTNYLMNDFVSPVQNYEKAKQLDEDNELLAKFKFIAGLSHAKTGNFSSFEKELNGVVKEYSESEVAPVAIEILKLYQKGRMPVRGPVSTNLVAMREDEAQKDKESAGKVEGAAADQVSGYTVNNRAVHSLIIVLNPEADINRLRFNVADYNFSRFLLNDYEMSQNKLPDGSPLFVVSGFDKHTEALDYFYSIRENTDIFNVEGLSKYQLFVINKLNLDYLISSGDLTGYESFFKENYLSVKAYITEEENYQQEEKAVEEKQSIPSKKEESPAVPDTSEPEIKEEVRDTGSINNTTEEIEKEESNVKTDAESPNSNVLFVEESGIHNSILVFKKGRIDTKRLGIVFQNYTKNTFGAKHKVEVGDFAESFFYIKTEGFKNASAAEMYLGKVKQNTFLMRDIIRTQYYAWAITNDNFYRLKDEVTLKQYQNFYQSNYKK